jgi:hypothetical protein
LVSAAFKLPTTKNNEFELFPAGPYASFVGTIYEGIEQSENDCKFGVNLLEYNNFSFANKEKMNFKTQVVYEAGPNSRFNRLASRLQIGKTVFISGFFDLNENELPFIEAKEIDLLDDFNNNFSQSQPTNINLRSPFSRTNKFKSNKDIVQSSRNKSKFKETEIEDNNDDQLHNVIIKSEKDEVVTSTSSIVDDQLISNKPKKNNKRKKDLADLSIQRMNKSAKNTKVKVKTRSQKKMEEVDAEEIDAEESI